MFYKPKVRGGSAFTAIAESTATRPRNSSAAGVVPPAAVSRTAVRDAAPLPPEKGASFVNVISRYEAKILAEGAFLCIMSPDDSREFQ